MFAFTWHPTCGYDPTQCQTCHAALQPPKRLRSAVKAFKRERHTPSKAVKTATICGGVCVVICVAVALGVLIPWKIDSDHCAEDATTTEEEDACIANLALIPATIAAVGAILCVMIAFGVCLGVCIHQRKVYRKYNHV